MKKFSHGEVQRMLYPKRGRNREGSGSRLFAGGSSRIEADGNRPPDIRDILAAARERDRLRKAR